MKHLITTLFCFSLASPAYPVAIFGPGTIEKLAPPVVVKKPPKYCKKKSEKLTKAQKKECARWVAEAQNPGDMSPVS